MLDKNKKNLIVFLIAIFFVFNFNIKKANAGGWWFESIAAEIMHETWAETTEIIKGTLIKELKQQGLRLFANNITGEANEYLIPNFNTYLSGDVNSETGDYITDFYKTVASNDRGVSGGYAEMARGITEKAIKNDLSSNVGESDIEKNFSSADVRENLFNESLGGGVQFIPEILGERENLYGRFIGEATKISNTREVIKEGKITDATGHGYAGKGEVSGEVLAGMVSKVETRRQDLLANAENATEVALLMGDDAFDPFAILEQSMDIGKDALKEMSKKALRSTYQGIANGVVTRATGGTYNRKGKVQFSGN